MSMYEEWSSIIEAEHERLIEIKAKLILKCSKVPKIFNIIAKNHLR